MKKLFLLGTMLGVASVALAFGGMFNHGSKSTIYKGGVDAIGVHFGGEKKTADSEPKKETCPAEKQCGDYCCQGDNVCQANSETGELQCCSEELDHCCPSGSVAFAAYRGFWQKECCSGKIYTTGSQFDGRDDYRCCPAGRIVHGPLDLLDDIKTYYCCAEGEQVYIRGKFYYGNAWDCCNGNVYEGKGLDGGDLCCSDGKIPKCAVTDEPGACIKYICCSENESPYYSGSWYCD